MPGLCGKQFFLYNKAKKHRTTLTSLYAFVYSEAWLRRAAQPTSEPQNTRLALRVLFFFSAQARFLTFYVASA